MKHLNSILQVKDENRSGYRIIFWWETRRLLYNFIVLICGILSLIIIEAIAYVPDGEDLFEPFAVFGFAFVCNVAYSFGWLTEIFIKKDILYGPKMFKRGLYFTLFFVFLPLIIHIISWIFRGFTRMH